MLGNFLFSNAMETDKFIHLNLANSVLYAVFYMHNGNLYALK